MQNPPAAPAPSGAPWWWPNAVGIVFALLAIVIALIDHWIVPTDKSFGSTFDLGLLAASGITSSASIAHAIGLQTTVP